MRLARLLDRTQTFCDSGRRRRTGPAVIQRRTNSGDNLICPEYSEDEEREPNSALIQRRTNSGDNFICPEYLEDEEREPNSGDNFICPERDKEREHPGDKKTGVKLICQGQEKKVIIVSTVRSSPEYVSMDSQNKLGFLFNSKKILILG